MNKLPWISHLNKTPMIGLLKMESVHSETITALNSFLR